MKYNILGGEGEVSIPYLGNFKKSSWITNCTERQSWNTQRIIPYVLTGFLVITVCNPTVWPIALYYLSIDQTWHLLFEKKHFTAHFQPSCTWLLNDILMGFIFFLSFKFNFRMFYRCLKFSLLLSLHQIWLKISKKLTVPDCNKAFCNQSTEEAQTEERKTCR